MCRFKSGIVLKNRVVLAPKGNNSHSDLLESLNIEDDYIGASKTFVRIELVPPNNDVLADINEWEYVVDQDIVPEWYEEDKKKYEQEFRNSVHNWVKENIVVICGKPFEVIKRDDDKTYYLLHGKLYNSIFCKSSDYEKSTVRKDLLKSSLAKDLEKEFGDRLVPVNEYGDVIAIPSFELYKKCRNEVSILDDCWWLSTGCSHNCVQCIYDVGFVDYDFYGFDFAVRPFFILKS